MDIPLEVRTLVYERLHAMDRASFNRAIPARLRDTTTKARDKRLRLLWHLFQRRVLVPAHLPSNVIRFMLKHQDDPTVVSIVRDHGVVLREEALLMDKINRGVNFALEDVVRVSTDVIQSPEFARLLEDAISERMSPALYEALVGDPRVRQLFLDERFHSLLVFNALNRRDYPLCEYFLAREAEDEIVRLSFQYMRKPSIAKIFASNLDKTRFMMQRFCLSDIAKSRVLDEAVKHFDNDDIIAVVLTGLTDYVA